MGEFDFKGLDNEDGPLKESLLKKIRALTNHFSSERYVRVYM